jgi:uncharacterized protein YhfF
LASQAHCATSSSRQSWPGDKTTTTGLAADYEDGKGPLSRPGVREAVVDSAGHPVAVIETTAVRVMRLGDVDLAHALAEGERYTTVPEWRAGQEQVLAVG